MRGLARAWRPTSALLVVSLGTAEGAPSAQVSPVQMEATRVTLTVIVSRGGQPVPDLTAADVEVLDDGVVQAIDTFEYVDSVSGDSPEPPGDFVLVLDDLGTSAAGTSEAISVGLALVDALGPHDRLAVVNTGPFPLLQQLSTNRAASRTTMRQFLGQRDSSASRSEACRRSVVSLGVIENALEVMARQPSTRRAMLVLSDSRRVYWGQGREQKCSEARKVFDRVVVASSVANVPIYGIDQGAQESSAVPAGQITPNLAADGTRRIRRPSDVPNGSLAVLARMTGGAFTDAGDVPHQLVRDTRQYVRVVYRRPEVPRGSGHRFRQVDVRVRSRGIAVRARQMYAPK